MPGFRWSYRLPPRGIAIGVLTLVVLLIASGLIFAFSEGHALDSTGTLWLPGSYVLTHDIVASGSSAIELRGGHIDLNLNGKTISCLPNRRTDRPTVGVDVRRWVTARIYNGSIRGCDIGIRAVGARAVDVGSVNLSTVTYMGIDSRTDRLIVRGSKFSNIGGYQTEAYAIGINVQRGDACHIEANEFSELYRQEAASSEMIGEGVGVVLGTDTEACSIVRNTFANERVETNSIGIWVAQGAKAEVFHNMLSGFESGIVGGGLIHATDNVLQLDPPGGNASYGIYGGPGSELSGNLIVGYRNSRSIMQQNGKLLVIK